MKSNLESFIDLIHERIWSVAILSQNLQINYYELYHCYICNMIWQIIMKSNLESFIDFIHRRIWSMAILATKSSNEIWSFWTKMRVGANPDHEKIGRIFGQEVSFWNAELKFWFSLWWTWILLDYLGRGSYILIAMSRR